MKWTYKKILLVVVVLILLVIYQNTRKEAHRKESNTEKQVHFSQYVNGSLGESWEYILSDEGILKEDRKYLSLLGKYENWVFTPIGEGELTITWNLYQEGGSVHNKKETYSITYCFDKEGNYTVLKDTREADE